MKISAVLPVKVDHHKTNSLDQIQFLLASMVKFFDKDFLHAFYIVCPKSDIEYIQTHYQTYISSLPIYIIDEEELVPLLNTFPYVRGWRKQQIIKLAISERMETEFFITFDADVLVTKKLSSNLLLPNGKALLQPMSKTNKQNWWSSSAHVLDMPLNLEREGMYVTPAILSTVVCKQLISYLNAKENWVKRLLKSHNRPAFLKLLPYFKRTKSWSEYSLYYQFMEKNGWVDQYHFVLPELDQRSLISPNSVWNAISFDAWDASVCFSEEDPGLFCVIQSNKYLPINTIHQKIAAFIY